MLAAHLSHCADCRAYEADVVRITTELRSAPLERMDNPIVIRRPRRVSALRLQAGVAAALAIATVGVVLQTAVPGPERSSSPYTRTLTQFGNSGEAAQELRQIIADARAFKRHGQKSTVAM